VCTTCIPAVREAPPAPHQSPSPSAAQPHERLTP
jgi:hypothetical protein